MLNLFWGIPLANKNNLKQKNIMKKFILLLAAMIAVNAYAQKAAEAPERKNWDRGNLYGNVKSVTVDECELNFHIGGYSVVDRETYKFNKYGDVVEHTFAEDELGIAKYKYVYDKNRNVLEWIGYSPKGKIVAKYVYSYNEQGKVIDEIFYKSPDLKNCNYKLVRSYDDKGLLMGGVFYNSSGEVRSKYSFTYDDKGQRIKEVYEDETHIFGYDDNGNRTSQTTYLPDGTLKNSTQISYDGKGNVINEKWYDGEGVLYSDFTAKYNDAGLPIESILLDGEGHVIEEYCTEYDEYGNVVDEYVSKNYGSYKTHHLIEYDEQGREVECNAMFNTFENKFVSFYDSQNNVILVDIYEVLSDNDYLTMKKFYNIKYRK